MPCWRWGILAGLIVGALWPLWAVGKLFLRLPIRMRTETLRRQRQREKELRKMERDLGIACSATSAFRPMTRRVLMFRSVSALASRVLGHRASSDASGRPGQRPVIDAMPALGSATRCPTPMDERMPWGPRFYPPGEHPASYRWRWQRDQIVAWLNDNPMTAFTNPEAYRAGCEALAYVEQRLAAFEAGEDEAKRFAWARFQRWGDEQ